jgi:small subunit ribosomal protein S11
MGKKKVTTQTGDAALKETTGVENKVSDAKAVAPVVAKRGRRIDQGRVYVKASYNNTVITVTDDKGGVLAWATAGSIGFSGPKKATPFAASKIVAVLSEKMKNFGMQNIEVYVRGIGSGRDSAVRSFINQGFNVSTIKDVTGIPHNGPRPRKVRRV